MGLSPDEWRRALAATNASPEMLNAFGSVTEQDLLRMRAEEEQRQREETQRALDQLGGRSAQPAMDPAQIERELLAANGAPDYDARAARGEFGSRGPRPPQVDMAITPEEIEQYERTRGVPENPYDSPEVQQALAIARGEQQPLPPRNQEIDAAYQARALPKMDPNWEGGRADRGVRRVPGQPALDTDAIAAAELEAYKRIRPDDPELKGDLNALGVTGAAPKFDPRSPALPPDTDRALELTGSDYRTQQPESDEQRLRREDAEFAGRKGFLAADSLQRQADIQGEKAASVRESLAETRKSVEERRGQQRNFEAMAMERLQRITALADNPPEEVTNKARVIMGGLLNFASGGRVSDGRKAMGEALAADVERWKAEISANKALLDATLDMSKHAGGEAERDARLDGALLEYGFGAYNAAFEQEKLTAQSQEQRRQAEEAQRTLEKAYPLARMWTMPIPELRAYMAKGELGEEGQKILAERVKTDQGTREGELEITGKSVGIQKTQAETEKLRREAGGQAPGVRVAGGFEVADPQIWGNIENSTKTEFEKGASKVPGLVSRMRELRKMVDDNGTEGTWTNEGATMSTLSAGILADYKEAARLGALDNGVAALVEKIVGDANSMTPEVIANVGARLDQAIKQTQDSTVTNATALGLRPMKLTGDQPPPPSRSGGGPADSGKVLMSKDGRTVPIRSDMVAEARRRGYVEAGR